MKQIKHFFFTTGTIIVLLRQLCLNTPFYLLKMVEAYNKITPLKLEEELIILELDAQEGRDADMFKCYNCFQTHV